MKVSISPSIVIMILIYAASGKLNIIAIPIIAAAIHEAGHLLCASVLSIPLKRIKLNIFGAAIETDPLSCTYLKEALLTLSGPLFNVLTAIIILAAIRGRLYDAPISVRYFFVSSISLAFINMLPIDSFDGGRLLSCMLISKYSPNSVYKIIEYLSLLFVFILWSFSIYLLIKTGSSLSLFIFSGVLFAHIFSKSDLR